MALCTHFDRRQPAYSQSSCTLSVMSCLFSMSTCGCVRLYALKLPARCARYSALRRSLPHLMRAALLTPMRLCPLHFTRGCVRVYVSKLRACCTWYSALLRSLPHLTRAALLTAMRSRPPRITHGCLRVYALKFAACCARPLLSLCQHMFFHSPYHLCGEEECTDTIPAGV